MKIIIEDYLSYVTAMVVIQEEVALLFCVRVFNTDGPLNKMVVLYREYKKINSNLRLIILAVAFARQMR
jgi:hypothetical protein